jgi:hypothetical protein
MPLAPTHATMLKINYIYIPIGVTTQLLYDILLACALFAIAVMLQRIAETGSGTLHDAIAPIKLSIRRILVFAFTLCGLEVIAGLLISFLSPLLPAFYQPDLQIKLEHLIPLSVSYQIALQTSKVLSYLFSQLFAYFWSIPITLCVVYIIAPLQVRLIQPPDTNPTAQQASRARIAGTLAALASAACAFLLFQFRFGVIPSSSPGAIYFFQLITSLITLAIYTPLFIAIYLIATPESPLDIPPPANTESVDSASDDIPE